MIFRCSAAPGQTELDHGHFTLLLAAVPRGLRSSQCSTRGCLMGRVRLRGDKTRQELWEVRRSPPHCLTATPGLQHRGLWGRHITMSGSTPASGRFCGFAGRGLLNAMYLHVPMGRANPWPIVGLLRSRPVLFVVSPGLASQVCITNRRGFVDWRAARCQRWPVRHAGMFTGLGSCHR